MRIVLTLIVAGFAAVFALSSAHAQAKKPTNEKECTDAGLTWQEDRCFTKQACRMKSGTTGQVAYKDGVLGCSRIREGQTAEERKKWENPDELSAQCVKAGYTWSIDRCFSGGRCPYRLEGGGTKQGWVAVMNGVEGCSEYGPTRESPRPRRSKMERDA